jgi:uncharacterized protein YaaN involved in tellurite resistance
MAESYAPTLTLDPDSAAPAVVVMPTDEEALAKRAAAAALDLSQLTEAEQKQVLDFSQKIDITDTNAVLTYGAASQRHISDFSESTLKSVRAKDMGQVGEMISSLVAQLRGFNCGEEEKKGLFGLRKKIQNRLETVKAEYDRAETNIDTISAALERHQVALLKDAAMLDKMYDINQTYFKELTMYILAGKKKLDECKNATLPELQNKARESGLPEDAQTANDYMHMINRFEKKLYDLELTRMISIQMAPQIRLIQNNDALMIEKIQTSIANTIPLWKSQMVLALGMHHARQAMEAQREVSNMTNELLRRNAETLKTGTLETARESERGIADIETLVATNQSLIETLEEVCAMQIEGSEKRRAAEAELGRIEGELKQRLLSIRNR